MRLEEFERIMEWTSKSAISLLCQESHESSSFDSFRSDGSTRFDSYDILVRSRQILDTPLDDRATPVNVRSR